ncbi:hypothetical protein [Maricaulis sp.]|uniref:hypothetical protein n=1 Tax=Maricaulis sp. TaxID=1486257 RepID=UPI003A8CA6A9
MSQTFDYDKALLDPADMFDTPEDVLTQPGLTTAQKIDLLRRWEYDANEVAVAEEEGMQGEKPLMVRRVALALETLTGGSDADRLKTTKQNTY